MRDVESYCANLADELRRVDGQFVALTIAVDSLTNSPALSLSGDGVSLTVNLLALVAAAAAYAFEQGDIAWRG